MQNLNNQPFGAFTYLIMKTHITLQDLPFIIGGITFITIVAVWLITYIQTIPA